MTTSVMSLKVNKSWRRIAKWVVGGVFAVLFLIYLIRVMSFENYYYNSKEGSERAAAVMVEEEEELVEEKPAESEVKEYVVAADRPRYLTIEKLKVYQARVLAVGVKANGELGTPNNIFDVGWYEASGKPGQGGTMLVDGHNGGPHVHGVFKKLPDLNEGDIITVERGDGVIYNYSVVENVEVPLDEADGYMAIAMHSPEKGKESITLITCSGEWSAVRKTYLSRQFVRATLQN